MSIVADHMISGTTARSAEPAVVRLLRFAGLIAALLGAAGSLAFMFYAGRNNSSRLLLALFTIWVLSPFVGLIAAWMRSKSWPALMRTSLYVLMLVLAFGSVMFYASVALGPRRPQGAFVFVITPPISWLLMVLVIPIAAFIARRAR